MKELERQAEEFKISLGDLSRAVVDRYIKNEEFRSILTVAQAIGDFQERQGETLNSRLADLTSEVKALRRDFNEALSEKECVVLKRKSPRISEELMATLFEFVMDNLPVLLDAEGPIEIFFGEMFILIDDELERVVQEDRHRRIEASDN